MKIVPVVFSENLESSESKLLWSQLASDEGQSLANTIGLYRIYSILRSRFLSNKY